MNPRPCRFHQIQGPPQPNAGLRRSIIFGTLPDTRRRQRLSNSILSLNQAPFPAVPQMPCEDHDNLLFHLKQKLVK